LGGRKGIRPVKNEWWGVGVVVCLERGADLHMAQLMPLSLTVSCSSKIQIGFTFLVPAYPGCPGKEAVKWLCSVLYVSWTLVDWLLVCIVRHRPRLSPSPVSNVTTLSCTSVPARDRRARCLPQVPPPSAGHVNTLPADCTDTDPQVKAWMHCQQVAAVKWLVHLIAVWEDQGSNHHIQFKSHRNMQPLAWVAPYCSA